MIHKVGNLRFTLQKYRPGDPDNTVYLISTSRISDGHWLPQQMWFETKPTPEELAEAAQTWILAHPDAMFERPAAHCRSCNGVLESDHDTDYQYDNALWIGFHGGYAMFVDACDYPTNTEDRWLRHGSGEYVLDANGQPIEDPDWEPHYTEARVLPGRPDHEAVICHDCAHALCAQVPWIAELLKPERSHAHRSADHPRLRAEGHKGWDLDRDWNE